MPLPDFKGFSNGFGISQETSGLDKTLSSNLDFSFTSMKRINNNILMHGQFSMGTSNTSLDINADWIINNSMQIRCSPISIINGQFNMPKIGVDKVFNSFSFSSITDFQHLNFEISDHLGHKMKNKFSKSVKIVM